MSLHKITTGMGNSQDWSNVPSLTQNDVEELNSIGYSGKKKDGTKKSLYEYFKDLNESPQEYIYELDQTSFDKGDFREEYMLCVVKKP